MSYKNLLKSIFIVYNINMRAKLKTSTNNFIGGAKYKMPLLYIILIAILAVIIIGLLVYVFYPKKSDKNNYYEEEEEEAAAACPKKHVCMHQKTFNDVIRSKDESESIKIVETREQIPSRRGMEDPTVSRDRRVLNDPLFPPLNRTDRLTFDSVAYETKQRNINIPTNDIGDRFRQVGYVTLVSQEGEKDAGGNQWKLLGREKNRHESEFYMVPTNNNYDIKVPLTPEVVVGPRLKDIYTIPNELRFKSPLLNKGTYEFVELPKTDFADSYYL